QDSGGEKLPILHRLAIVLVKTSDLLKCPAADQRIGVAEAILEHPDLGATPKRQEQNLAILFLGRSHSAVEVVGHPGHDVGGHKYGRTDKVFDRRWHQQIVVIQKDEVIAVGIAHGRVPRCPEVNVLLENNLDRYRALAVLDFFEIGDGFWLGTAVIDDH